MTHEWIDPAPNVGTRCSSSPVERVALLSVHTCPLDQPGTGDSGGMNVYVRSVARRLAEMGVAVDIFSRWAGMAEHVCEPDPGVRVIHLEAGPDRPVPKEELHGLLPAFLHSLQDFARVDAVRYDVVHSHYWLSGWVGRLAAARWDVPLVHTFHTLARVKNQSLHSADTPEPPSRIAAEERIAQSADCVLAPTAHEAADLVGLYGAPHDRVRIVSPGVDTDIFRPATDDRRAAKDAIGLAGRDVILFAGRLQPLKSPDIAVQALASLVRTVPSSDPVLVVLGGPSGTSGMGPTEIAKIAADLGVVDRVMIRPPVPHRDLASYYQAADAVIVPSRNESFGLVALEASACGAPVVATDVGGLRTAIRDGITGLLVPGSSPEEYARAIARILRDRDFARSMSAAGARFAKRYDWRRAATSLLDVYEETAERHRA